MGESKALKRVLDFTYGRIGKPRYSLLQEFFEPDTPNSHTELQSLQDHPESLAKQRGWPVVSTKLEALAKSHVRHGNMVDSSRGTLKRSTPEIPSKNAWGRPFPRKREDNLRLKYHGTLKQRLLPPLPEAEWKLLKGLATGKMPWTGPVACRTPAIEMNKMAESGSEIASLADVLIAEPHKKQLGSGHIRSITPRVMRRLWSLVLMQCSVMRQDPNGRSTFEWGMAHGEAARRVRVVSLKDRRLMNVNSAGRHSC
ncbi:MAG: hypothetical protein M1829_000779 [Trizodia sp. TS-e1964]|nr:MAG: hypothetical protein M1829_000779 [Trizodia sp. TS-e1964]